MVDQLTPTQAAQKAELDRQEYVRSEVARANCEELPKLGGPVAKPVAAPSKGG